MEEYETIFERKTKHGLTVRYVKSAYNEDIKSLHVLHNEEMVIKIIGANILDILPMWESPYLGIIIESHKQLYGNINISVFDIMGEINDSN